VIIIITSVYLKGSNQLVHERSMINESITTTYTTNTTNTTINVSNSFIIKGNVVIIIIYRMIKTCIHRLLSEDAAIRNEHVTSFS